MLNFDFCQHRRRRPASALVFTRHPHQLWGFIVASIHAGLLSLPASALDFYCCQHPRWTFIISVNIVVNGQPPCWTCAFFFVDIVVDCQHLLLDLGFIFCQHCCQRPASPAGLAALPALALGFSFWSADSFRGPSPGTLFVYSLVDFLRWSADSFLI